MNMPRKARIDAPGALHHIICRGIEEQRVFRDDKDRDNFVKRLGKILEDSSTIFYYQYIYKGFGRFGSA